MGEKAERVEDRLADFTRDKRVLLLLEEEHVRERSLNILPS